MDEPTPRSRARGLASQVYDAGAGGRHALLDGPGWLVVTGVAAVALMVLGSAPWTWIGIAVLAVLFWLPSLVRWTRAVRRSPRAFREGYRG